MKTLLLLSILFTTSILADFREAADAYDRGEYAAAYKAFLSMAQSGEKRSQFNLGVMYYQGQHVSKDISKSYAWLKLATESDTIGEQEKKIFEIVKSKVKDFSKAEKEHRSLADQYSTQVLLNSLYPEFISPENGGAFQATPIKIVPPRYPRKAALKGIQGWSRFNFDLDTHGIPRNIQLIESFPGDMFALTSKRAIEKWRFKVALDKDQKPMPRPNLLYTMEFRIAKAKSTQMVDPIRLKKGIYESSMKRALKGDYNAQFEIGYWETKLNISEGKMNPNEWFLKAAIQGHPTAQYELGKNLVYGTGCRLDKAKGLEWLTRSAHNGQTAAKQLLATVASKVKTLASHKEAIALLKDMDEDRLSATTKLNYAWLLATSPFDEVADPKRSLDIVDSMSRKTFSDDITLYEIQAAAYAAMGKFKKARSYQEDALEEAKDREADLTDIKDHLAYYQKNEKWF